MAVKVKLFVAANPVQSWHCIAVHFLYTMLFLNSSPLGTLPVQTKMSYSYRHRFTSRLSTCCLTSPSSFPAVWPARAPRCPCTERCPQRSLQRMALQSPTTRRKASSCRTPAQSTRAHSTAKPPPEPHLRSQLSTCCFMSKVIIWSDTDVTNHNHWYFHHVIHNIFPPCIPSS